MGGDGLAREVVAAIMESPSAHEATLSVVGAGSDCDFVKTFGLPPDAATAVPRLLTGAEYPIDVVRVTCAAARRGHARDALRRARGGGALGGRDAPGRAASRAGWAAAGAFAAFWWTMATFRVPEMTVTADERSYRGRAHEVVVGNTQQARGGIRVSPRSFPGDGVLDVLVMRGPRSDQYTLLPKMFMGEQLPNPGSSSCARANASRSSGSRPLWMQADTEPHRPDAGGVRGAARRRSG